MTKKKWILPTVLFALFVVFGSAYLILTINKKEPLNEEELRTQLEEMYGGTVEFTKTSPDRYEAEIVKGNGKYAAQVDSLTGAVLSIQRTEKAEMPQANALSEDEVRDLISKKYKQPIEKISFHDSGKKSTYAVQLNGDTTVTVDAITGKVLSETNKETKDGPNQAMISLERAIEIAQGQLNGEIEDVEYENTEDGGFYLIEIDGDNKEAVIQVHAISGKIISVTWKD